MSAFDEILSHHSKDKFNDFRQALVSHRKGTLSSGTFATAMSALYETNQQQENLLEESTPKKFSKIVFLKNGHTQQPGFIFDSTGTERALSIIANAGKIKLNEDFSNFLKFTKSDDKEAWLQADRANKKRCIAKNVEDLIKKTDINYRTHGDRLHYFVAGLVTTKDKNQIDHYPLFLFTCSDISKQTLEVEAESTGFLNFWLDRNLLESTAAKALNGYEVNLDESFGSTLNSVAGKIAALQSAEFETITVDPKYSAITIVTGFEAEYIDPVWEKIL